MFVTDGFRRRRGAFERRLRGGRIFRRLSQGGGNDEQTEGGHHQ